jgi:hypothetical protein
MSYQLKLGKKVEREHLGTIRKLKSYRQRTGKCMSDNKIIESIAKDHLKEDKNYYTKLKEANL